MSFFSSANTATAEAASQGSHFEIYLLMFLALGVFSFLCGYQAKKRKSSDSPTHDDVLGGIKLNRNHAF